MKKHLQFRITTLVVAAGVVCGCQRLTYNGPSGERFSRTSFGSTISIAIMKQLGREFSLKEVRSTTVAGPVAATTPRPATNGNRAVGTRLGDRTPAKS